MTFTVMSLSLMHDTTLTAVRWHYKRPSFTSVGSDITERLLPVILNIKTRKITKYTLIYGKCPKISNTLFCTILAKILLSYAPVA